MGLFISFEGPDGGGKSTQVRLLADWLTARGCDILITREPGGTRIGDAVRNLVLDPTYTEMRPEAELLLYSTARAQLTGEKIRPHLEKGGVVLCDRYADSTLAYQGYGRGLDIDVLRVITGFATGNLWPGLTLCLDLPVEEGLRRKQGCSLAEWNRIERQLSDFHERVRNGFLTLAAAEPQRWLVLDATQPVDELQEQIRRAVLARLG